MIVNAEANSFATNLNSSGESSSDPSALIGFNHLSWNKTPHASMESEGIDSKCDTSSNSYISFRFSKRLSKCLSRASALSML